MVLKIKMIKICSESLAVPLKIIFGRSLKEGRFLEIWKIANVFQVHKKEDKNYRPISLLTIFSKIFERVIDNSLFNHFQRNKNFLLLHNQVFFLEIPVLANYSQLLMKYKQRLITTQLLIREVHFLIYQKVLIKSGIVVFYSSYRYMGLKVNNLPDLNIIFIIVNKK